MRYEIKLRSHGQIWQKSIRRVLIHDPNNLEGCDNSRTWNMLKDMKEEGYMKKTGISVYNPSQAEKLARIYKPDIIQLPINAFDKQAAKLGTLKRLKNEGVEIHARSIFLQGLLLMNIKDLSDYFKPWVRHIEEWHKYCLDNRLTLLEGAITNAMGQENIDKFIIGIEDTKQLKQIIEATRKTVKNYFDDSTERNEGLINPTNWKVVK